MRKAQHRERSCDHNEDCCDFHDFGVVGDAKNAHCETGGPDHYYSRCKVATIFLL